MRCVSLLAALTAVAVGIPAAIAQEANPAAAAPDPLAFLPEKVATLGDQAITREELRQEAKPFLQMAKMQLAQGGQPIPEEEWRNLAKKLTEQLINIKLLLGLAAADGIRPSPEKGEREYQKLIAEIPEEQLKLALAQQGLTMAELREKIAIAGAVQEWIEGVAAKIEVSDDEIGKFYQGNAERFKQEETAEVSHILVHPKELTDEEKGKLTAEQQTAFTDKAKTDAKAKAEGLLKRVQAGEDFGKLAEAESDCPSGKRQQGQLGEISRGEMVKPFEDAAFALAAGTVSGLVETEFGYHIIKTTKRTPGGATPLAEVRPAIKGELQKRAVDEKIRSLLEAEKQKQNAKILI